MPTSKLRFAVLPAQMFVLALLATAALVLGLASAVLPSWFIAAMLALPVYLLIAFRFPEFGLLFIILLMTGLVPSHFLPRMSLLGGQVNPSDLFLAVLLPLSLLQGHKAIIAAYARRPSLWVLTVLLGLAILVSTALAMAYMGTDRKAVLAEARILGYWLVLPIALACLGDAQRRRRFLMGLVGVGLLVALGQIVQALFETPVFEGTRLEMTETLGRTFSGAVRSVAPGIMVLLFALLVSVAMFITGSSRRLAWVLIFGTLALGLVFTYGRTLWLIALLGILMTGASLGWRRLLPMAVGVGVAALALLAILAVLRPVVVEALVDRATSYEREVASGGSFNWRRIENRYALLALERNPWVGVGMGGNYKPYLSPDLLPEQTRHIHSGYLYMALKLGIPATVLSLGALLFMALSALWRSRRFAIPGLANAAAVAAPVFVLMPFLSAITRPEWMTSVTIAMTAVAVAITVSSHGHSGAEPAVAAAQS